LPTLPPVSKLNTSPKAFFIELNLDNIPSNPELLIPAKAAANAYAAEVAPSKDPPSPSIIA
jgi:hypothetical protein